MGNLIFFIALAIGTVCGDPGTKLTINKIDIKMTSNPYFADWAATVAPSKEAVSLKVPITKDLPPEMMLNMDIQLGDDDLGSSEMTMCEAMKNELIGQDIVASGTPKGKFPTDCPIKAGTDFAINNYLVPKEKVPPGIPDGPLSGTISIYEAGKDPLVTITFAGELAHAVPGFGR